MARQKKTANPAQTARYRHKEETPTLPLFVHERLSEQTISILSGYSISIYKWSQRSQPGFAGLRQPH